MGAYSGVRPDKYNMKRIRLSLALLLLPTLGFGYQAELQPPDADVYLEVQGVRSDYGKLDGSWENGLRVRVGLQFNEARLGRWVWRLEGGLNQFGESRLGTRTVHTATPGDLFFVPGQTTTVTTDSEASVRLNGFEFGARLYDSELFYVRGGAFLYNLKTKYEEDLVITNDAGDPTQFFSPTPESESTSAVGPYLGAGIEFPLVRRAKLQLEYNWYRIEDDDLDNLALGLQFSF